MIYILCQSYHMHVNNVKHIVIIVYERKVKAMAKLKKNHFYYGAILDALCQYNPDASPVLMSHEESRQVYRVMTNTSEECILFFKYASPKTNSKNDQDTSYLFTFSDDDKQKLKNYKDKYDCPIFLYLLCKQSDLKDSEIIVLKYEEYQNVEENRAITIRIQKSKNYILLFKKGSKSRDNAYQVPRNRIEKTFDELADDIMKESTCYAKKKEISDLQMDSFIAPSMEIFDDNRECPFCNSVLENAVIHNNGNDMKSRVCPVCKRRFVNRHQYEVIYKYCGSNKIIPELYIMDFHENKGKEDSEYKKAESQGSSKEISRNKFYVIEDEDDICPIHNCKMDIRVINFGNKQKDTVHFCKRCNKRIISRKQYKHFRNQCVNGGKRILRNVEFERLL